MKGLLKTLGGLVVATLAGLVGWLALFPPELLKVGDGYAAKIVCSNVFRDAIRRKCWRKTCRRLATRS